MIDSTPAQPAEIPYRRPAPRLQQHPRRTRKVGECVVSQTAKPHAELNRARRFDIEAVMRFRGGQGLVDKGAEALFLHAITPHLMALAADGREREAVASWIRRRCPRLVAERGLDWIEAYAATAGTVRFLNAQMLGNLLCLTERERSRFGITTAWVVGWSRADYERHRRASKAACAQRARERDGAVPRALSVSALRPWEAEGLKRAGWYAKHSEEEREAIVGRLRGQFRGHQTSPSGRGYKSQARHEPVQAVQPRVAVGAPPSAPNTPTAAVEPDVGGVRGTPGLKPERRSHDTISSRALGMVLARVLTRPPAGASRGPQSENNLAAGDSSHDLTHLPPGSSRWTSRWEAVHARG